MATLKQAEAARTRHADALASDGAHAVGVEPSGAGWCVVAYHAPQAEPGPALKTSLRIDTDRGRLEVPLKVVRQEPCGPG